jgi:hypothetical protein
MTESVALSPDLFEGSIMTEFRPCPEDINARIYHPACPKCRAHTMLARIMPAGVGFNLRTFECPKCDHVHEVLVETDAFGRSFIPRKTG